MKTKKPPVEPVNTFVCETCEGNPSFTPKRVKEHLTNVHKITTSKGTKSMIMHLDCADSYTSQYQWTVDGVGLIQTIVQPRKEPMLGYKLNQPEE